MQFSYSEAMRQNNIPVWILQKMFRNRIICAKHISLEDLKTGLPSHVKDGIGKELKKLVKPNLLLTHPTSYGMQYHLNPQKINEIKKILKIS